MSDPELSVAERLDKLSAEFAELEPRDRLELLLEFCENLPALPERYEFQRAAGMHRVAECQTPVFLWAEVREGRAQVYAYAAPEAPTVKGFVAVLVETFGGAPVQEVLATDDNLVERFSLAEALGMQRMRGLHAVARHMRRLIAEAATGAGAPT